MHPDSQQTLAEFFQHLEIEKRASGHTLKSYQRDIKQLLSYCASKEIRQWKEIQPVDIRNHIATRHRKGIS
ncbi:MAG: site-specific integrase, partial [Methylococcales bacterium]|nr:site-specific integrase [Methylococcales bacterium]